MRHLFFATLACVCLPALAQRHERVVEFGFEQRTRNENWNNLFDFNDSNDDERGQVRWRTRLWARAPITSRITVNVGLVQETNQVFQPHTPTHFDEVIFESASVEIKELLAKGLSFRFGRMNVMKGEGFLFLEGDPYDGSRSIYMNAAVLGYERKRSRFELIGVADPSTDRYLPQFNSKRRQLVEINESALGAYYTSTRWKNLSLESYLFYKRESGDRRAASNPQYEADRYVYTAGARAIRKLPRSFSLTAEAARQWGHQRDGRHISAWGGYTYLKRNFGPQGRHNALFGYWGMSGSDPANPRVIGNWDPLFARWPKWSELYLYSQFHEVGVGYWTNTGMWQGELNYVPWKPLLLRATYYRMGAYHPYSGDQKLFSNGTFRGNNYQLRSDLTLNRNWRGHFVIERHAPGSFYAGRSAAIFVRLEIIYSFTRNFAL